MNYVIDLFQYIFTFSFINNEDDILMFYVGIIAIGTTLMILSCYLNKPTLPNLIIVSFITISLIIFSIIVSQFIINLDYYFPYQNYILTWIAIIGANLIIFLFPKLYSTEAKILKEFKKVRDYSRGIT